MDQSKFEALLKKAYENQTSTKKKPGRPKKKSSPDTSQETNNVELKKNQHTSITLSDIDRIYEETSFKPMQNEIFFIENDSRMHSNLISDDAVSATPIGALILKKKKSILPENETIFTTLFDEPSYCWTLGSIAQFLGYSCGYVQGFERGWNNYTKPHPNSGKDCHTGFSDAKRILDTYVERGLISLDPDPFEDEEDPLILRELNRCTGYWREDWEDCPPWQIDYYDDEDECEIFTEADVHNV